MKVTNDYVPWFIAQSPYTSRSALLKTLAIFVPKTNSKSNKSIVNKPRFLEKYLETSQPNQTGSPAMIDFEASSISVSIDWLLYRIGLAPTTFPKQSTV